MESILLRTESKNSQKGRIRIDEQEKTNDRSNNLREVRKSSCEHTISVAMSKYYVQNEMDVLVKIITSY